MKTILTALAFAALAVRVVGQGTVNIGTGAGANTKFIVTHTGERIGGPAYWAELFYANGVVTDESLLIGAGNPIHPRTGAAAGVLPSGEVRLEGITPPGGIATLQLRAWSAVLGNSHDEAYQAWLSQAPSDTRFYGRSACFQIDTGNPLASPPEIPPSIGTAFPGLSPPTIGGPPLCIPEPSTLALGFLVSIGALVAFQRRKPWIE